MNGLQEYMMEQWMIMNIQLAGKSTEDHINNINCVRIIEANSQFNWNHKTLAID